MKWTSEITVVDMDSGEELKRSDIGPNYYIVRKSIYNKKLNQHEGLRKIKWLCKSTQQLSLFNENRRTTPNQEP